MSSLRVVAGTWGGRYLSSPPGKSTRPTSARVREAMFNALVSLDVIEGAIVIDAFAGSGALGIEALSRGAAHVTMAEADASARSVVTANLTALECPPETVRVTVDARGALRAGGPFDLVLLDPPYAYDGWDDLLSDVAGALAPGGIVVIESAGPVGLPDGLVGIRSRAYGGTVVQFATTVGVPS